ncbi:hypothetical protein [Sphingomonas crocodyli]|uniref:Uncharacterized protein n=1 Tax=Sphingomonas crocodyli TaxID=1979270 RepID=A0A437M0Q8_9SPHN|nr:hypothetical protein [Sphingomonas crocodyli]RVT91299.1 hypothetical protein EOD43_17490 [Sphingomonas crocodyli]
MTIESALRDINNAVLDLQLADYNTFERPLERIARAFGDAGIAPVVAELKSKADFDKFIEDSGQGGSSLGSARLSWPTDIEQELGLIIHLIERGAKDTRWFLDFAFLYYYSGPKLVGNLRKITTAVIVPFNRDFATYFNERFPSSQADGRTSPASVTYNIGSLNNSPLQHISTGGHGEQTTSYSHGDLQAAVVTYRRHADELGLDPAQRRKADAQVATIEAQLIDEPEPSIIKAAGKSLKTIIEGALGGAAGTALASPSVWSPLLSMF